MSDDVERVGQHWDQVQRDVQAGRTPPRTRWWESPTVRQHLNRLLAPGAGDGIDEGLTQRARQRLTERGLPADRPLPRGISVGGGQGIKEMLLLKANLVAHLELYELSEARIADGQARAQAEGLSDRLRFIKGDALQEARGPYDLVHWNNSLHHMLDVDQALAWSHRVLAPGGMFYMDDFVGPTRFQWSTASLKVATALRSRLPERYLRDPRRPGQQLAKVVRRPNPETLARHDPSEAAQSGRILSAVRTWFPDAEILPTGGIVYNLVLSDVLANFDEAEPADRARLEQLLDLDWALTQVPGLETHYAIALAFKGGPPAAWRTWSLRGQRAIEEGEAELRRQAQRLRGRLKRR
ncbi:MAG: class I SAM-dependent methyltransferase [Deltaproteobacteria bacterium]|nr:class I SAM-dependent methyltransferase [Deltaproteobacteria bacterium]